MAGPATVPVPGTWAWPARTVSRPQQTSLRVTRRVGASPAHESRPRPFWPLSPCLAPGQWPARTVRRTWTSRGATHRTGAPRHASNGAVSGLRAELERRRENDVVAALDAVEIDPLHIRVSAVARGPEHDGRD